MKRLLLVIVSMWISCVGAMPVHDGWDDVSDIIAKVSIKSGVDATFLAAVGAIESGFRINAKAKGTTAAGLYQFTNRTWKVTLASYGDKYNLSSDVSKFDPFANTAMGAEYIKENVEYMQRRLNREVTAVEVYAAHLISPQRVVSISRMSDNTELASIYPVIARLNKNLFYSKGVALTKRQFLSLLNDKLLTEYERYSDLAKTAVATVKYEQWLSYALDYVSDDCNKNVIAKVNLINNFKKLLQEPLIYNYLIAGYNIALSNLPHRYGSYNLHEFVDRRRIV